ncbi:stalk domain-containing protein [Paenibacillus lutimineralis]|uniref:Copper amine oxidase n=1 Tax=Paenibacillus lutimineralis TaxID=2707005 RepID=A0A3S9UT86_9BACL|nr:stalk domain-containing protein [Paenibacillus lutimineralis]AZS13484.1 copper amine oxidase [Paenibacillus lutimineralis]
MTTQKGVLYLLLAASLLYSTPVHAESSSEARTVATSPVIDPSAKPATSPVSVYLDGRQLQLETEPILVHGTVLVPMRGLFEAQGAKLAWEESSKTVTATKGESKLIYRIGEPVAQLNGQAINLAFPGRIEHGYSLVPLRFVSEALGSSVKWEADTKTVRITSAPQIEYETSILWGVNLRTAPDAESQASEDLLPAGQKVHVVREASPFWLEVRTTDNRSGYISAKPKYTDYSNPALREEQANELLAYGMKYLGTPYEFGASSEQTKTFDCSSFVKRIFSDILSIDLPRVSYDQAKEGKEVGLNDLRKGDLLFFDSRGLDIGHVAIYAGDGQLLHTYSVKYGVRLEDFSDSWKKRFVTARRVF